MRSRGSQRRRDEIVRLATASGPASVEELARAFGVTASTIRRDLAALTAEGRLARTYGGAMPVTAHPEPPLRERTGEAFAAKRAIARAAVAEVGPGETVLLDAGSTVGALARELRSVPGLTVITVGLTALQELSDPAEIDAQGITVHCLGGTLRPLSQGFVGPLAEAALERLTFDRAFLGADGVTVEGLCEADLAQTRLKELMARRAAQVVVLAHGAKLGRRPFHAWARLDPGWRLITDDGADPRVVDRFRAAGIDVVVAGTGPGVTRRAAGAAGSPAARGRC
ncbi:MAG TPA: DeoR/GlpR family DNA-binding transcription regulator [Pseudonocardia sp.]|jgi:DeoR/GlpR family transcriptional regulator of sugar metabolism|uniref:DeoR/GlpR family DNA-binding transcription regulator n=1 Tax=Pseudonocardia sp. TaxID=60912 RepID=UPI002B4B5FDE|nr:DeoR/GlpR family DNA-binding transcription regulator [Pseudonocardia sp.]HLU53996.1 DeoR/GlpR family DNA-binding transcription regulator [Pseudonocardia sp.]